MMIVGSNEREWPDDTTGELQLEGKAKNVNSVRRAFMWRSACFR